MIQVIRSIRHRRSKGLAEDPASQRGHQRRSGTGIAGKRLVESGSARHQSPAAFRSGPERQSRAPGKGVAASGCAGLGGASRSPGGGTVLCKTPVALLRYSSRYPSPCLLVGERTSITCDEAMIVPIADFNGKMENGFRDHRCQRMRGDDRRKALCTPPRPRKQFRSRRRRATGLRRDGQSLGISGVTNRSVMKARYRGRSLRPQLACDLRTELTMEIHPGRSFQIRVHPRKR